MHTIYFAANYSEWELFALSIADETHVQRYRASQYPCFFDSQVEVDAYMRFRTYCAQQVAQDDDNVLEKLFPSVSSLQTYFYQYVSMHTVSDTFVDMVFDLLHAKPFLPLIDIRSRQFVATSHRKPQTYSLLSDHALVELSAAISYRQRSHDDIDIVGGESLPYFDSLLDLGLIVCVGSSMDNVRDLLERYSTVTHRSCIFSVTPDISYRVGFSDYTIALTGSLLTALTMVHSLYVFSSEDSIFDFSRLTYILQLPTNIFVSSSPVYVNYRQVCICMLTTVGFDTYFSPNARSHHNVIVIE